MKAKNFVDDTFNKFSDKINNDFNGLNRKNNPILKNAESYDAKILAWIINEHAAFLRRSIHFLLDSLVRSWDHPVLYKKLKENIEEELGSETKNYPHLEIMRQGYFHELGINVDIHESSYITDSFLKKLEICFNNNNDAFRAGALVALEGTAIEEFYIVDDIASEYAQRVKVNKNACALTSYYINGHKTFEINHTNEMIEAAKVTLTNPEDYEVFELGMMHVAITMNAWWNQVFHEAEYKKSEMNVFQNVPNNIQNNIKL